MKPNAVQSPLMTRTPWSASSILIGLAVMAAIAGLAIPFFGFLSVVFLIVAVAAGAILFDFRIGVVMLIIIYPVMTPVMALKLLPEVSVLKPEHLLLATTLGSYLLSRLGRKVQYRLLDPKLLILYLVPFYVAGLHAAPDAYRIARLSEEYATSFGTPAKFFIQLVVKHSLMIVFALLIGAAIRESKSPRRFLGVLFAGMMLPAVFILIHFATAGVSPAALVRDRNFLSTLGLHANQWAVLLNFGTAVLLFTALTLKQGSLKLLMNGAALFLAAALVITFSRGGYLSLVLIAICYIAFSGNWRAAFAALLIFAVSLPLLPDAVFDRVTLGWTHGTRDQLSSGRIDGLWLPILPDVLNAPIFGQGLLYFGRSDIVLSGRILGVSQAHNAYLDLLLDVGIVGLIMVVAFFYNLMKDFRHEARHNTDPVMQGFFRGAAVGLAGLLLHAFTDDRLFPNTPQLFMWMAYGVLVGCHPRWVKTPRRAKSIGRRSRHAAAVDPVAPRPVSYPS